MAFRDTSLVGIHVFKINKENKSVKQVWSLLKVNKDIRTTSWGFFWCFTVGFKQVIACLEDINEMQLF